MLTSSLPKGWTLYKLNIPDLDGQTHHYLSPEGTLHHAIPPPCYQCGKPSYLFDDSRCGDCTRLTPEEVRGEATTREDVQD